MDANLAPGLLVAVPHLTDPNFKQSVVLLLETNDEGAMGLVVNRRTDLLLGDLCEEQSIVYSGSATKRVRNGGPVRPEQGIVLYGAEHDDEEGREVVDGLHVSAAKGTLERLCSLAPGGRFHCFAGYAGWGPGQLDGELGDGAWIAVPAEASLVLETDPEQMWSTSLLTNGIDPAAIVPGGGGEA